MDNATVRKLYWLLAVMVVSGFGGVFISGLLSVFSPMVTFLPALAFVGFNLLFLIPILRGQQEFVWAALFMTAFQLTFLFAHLKMLMIMFPWLNFRVVFLFPWLNPVGENAFPINLVSYSFVSGIVFLGIVLVRQARPIYQALFNGAPPIIR